MVKVMKNCPQSWPLNNMQAAQVATEAGAKRLLLNISARFLSKDISQLKKDAATISENVHGQDLEEI